MMKVHTMRWLLLEQLLTNLPVGVKVFKQNILLTPMLVVMTSIN
jgi:hypothetical protein